MSLQESSAAGRAKPRALVFALAAAPVVLHAVGMGSSVLEQGMVRFGRLDLLVLLAVLGYLGLVALLLSEPRWIGRLLLVTYSVLVPLLGFELASGSWLQGTPAAVPWPPMQSFSTAADTMPGNTGELRFTANTLGLRGPEVSLDEVDLKILCVGGSTTECFYVTDEKTWPWLLGEDLSGRLKRRVFVGNAGRSGQFSRHHAYLLEHYALASRFEWVVLLCGINDAGSLLRDHYESSVAKLAEETLVQVRESNAAYYRRWQLFKSLGGMIRKPELDAFQIMQDPHGHWLRDARRIRVEALARRTIDKAPLELPTALNTYRRDLKRIIDLCRSRGQRLVMMTQPTLYQAEMPADLASLLWEHTSDGAYHPAVLDQVIRAYNETMIELCREQGIACLDLAGQLPRDTSVFYDDCHFNIAGCARIAELLGDFLAAKVEAGAAH